MDPYPLHKNMKVLAYPEYKSTPMTTRQLQNKNGFHRNEISPWTSFMNRGFGLKRDFVVIYLIRRFI